MRFKRVREWWFGYTADKGREKRWKLMDTGEWEKIDYLEHKRIYWKKVYKNENER